VARIATNVPRDLETLMAAATVITATTTTAAAMGKRVSCLTVSQRAKNATPGLPGPIVEPPSLSSVRRQRQGPVMAREPVPTAYVAVIRGLPGPTVEPPSLSSVRRQRQGLVMAREPVPTACVAVIWGLPGPIVEPPLLVDAKKPRVTRWIVAETVRVSQMPVTVPAGKKALTAK